jgi:NTE family protein
MPSGAGPVAFVLSGGANLGAVQAGMLQALLEAGIVPDLLVGTSIGAVNAAYLAASPTPGHARELTELWRGVSAEEFLPLRLRRIAQAVLAGRSLYSLEPLRRLLERELPYRRIEEAPTPLRIVATRLSSEALGRRLETTPAGPVLASSRLEWRIEHVFDSGPVIDAVLASSALPLIFPAQRIDGQVFVDGGLSEYVPLRPAIAAGARTVYVLSLGDARVRSGVAASLNALLRRRMGLTHQDSLTDHPETRVIMLPAPAAAVGMRDFVHLNELSERAREETSTFLRQPGPGD